MKRLGLLMLAVFIMMSCFVFPPIAASTTSEEVYSIDTPYEYPITSDMSEWAELSTHMSMVAACQIPEDILHAMTTEALVQTVINYPLAVDSYAYNTFEMGYERVKKQFNGLQELERRTDALPVLAQRQVAMKNMEESEKSFKDFWSERLFSIFLENSSPEISPRYTDAYVFPEAWEAN